METEIKKGSKVNKICSCGKLHPTIPMDAREWVDEGVLIGFVWECECHSSPFVPTFKIGRKEAA